MSEIRTPDANGDGTVESTTFSYEYQTIEGASDAVKRVTVHSGGRVSIHEYDDLGHMTRSRGPMGP